MLTNLGQAKDPVLVQVSFPRFQSLEEGENIGEMVPTPVIEHFLASAGDGAQVEVPGLGVYWQSLENPALRASLGLGDRSGVLVRAVDYDSSAWGTLRPGDVLLEIAGHPIADNGTIRYADRYRTSYTFDEEGRESGWTSERWYGHLWNNRSKNIYSFDEKGRQSGWITQQWSDSTWVNATRVKTDYEPDTESN